MLATVVVLRLTAHRILGAVCYAGLVIWRCRWRMKTATDILLSDNFIGKIMTFTFAETLAIGLVAYTLMNFIQMDRVKRLTSVDLTKLPKPTLGERITLYLSFVVMLISGVACSAIIINYIIEALP